MVRPERFELPTFWFVEVIQKPPVESIDKQEMPAWLKRNPGKDEWDYARAKAALAPTINYNLRAAGAGPSSDAEIVAGMLDGSLDVTKMASIRGNRREALIAQAKQQDPTFSMATFHVRQKVAEKFSSEPCPG